MTEEMEGGEEVVVEQTSPPQRGRVFPRINPAMIASQTRQNADHFALFVSESLRAIAVLYVLAWVTLWISAFIYGSFYFNFLPKVSFQVEPHFNYFHCHSEKETVSGTWSKGERGAGKGDRFCRFPTSSFSLLHNETLEAFMVQGQQYHLLLELEMPESDQNRNIGVFMATITIKEKLRDIFTIRRTAAMQHKSDLFSTLETVVLFPLFLAGYRKQSQLVIVDLGLITPPSNNLDSAFVRLESHDAVVTSANFVGMAKFKGIRYLLYFYPVTVAILSIGALFSVIFPVFAMAYFKWRHMMPQYMDFQSYQRFLSTRTQRSRANNNETINDLSITEHDVTGIDDNVAIETRGALEPNLSYNDLRGLNPERNQELRQRLNVHEPNGDEINADDHSLSSFASTTSKAD